MGSATMPLAIAARANPASRTAVWPPLRHTRDERHSDHESRKDDEVARRVDHRAHGDRQAQRGAHRG